MQHNSVNVIGLGYIGLPTALLLVESGFNVHGTDTSPSVLESIEACKPHFFEPGLREKLKISAESGRFSASESFKESSVYIICVPTPIREVEGQLKPDLSFVHAVIEKLCSFLKKGDLIILESTSPVGTTDDIAKKLQSVGLGSDKVRLAYCPERVLPGNAFDELINNDRVIGGIDSVSATLASNFYSAFIRGKVYTTNARTAEMCKLTENSYRDTNIAFANEVSMLCDKYEIDVWDLISFANMHPRVDVLQPGVGVGGHCIAVDPWFIISSNLEDSPLIQAARNRNVSKTKWVIEQILKTASLRSAELGRDIKIACLGLSFKPDIDDLRGAPAINVIGALKEAGYSTVVVEPNIKSHEDFELVPLDKSFETADLHVILVRHREFLNPFTVDKLKQIGALDFCGALSVV
jgi:UDP-N-acetyl-D-mannosaminuronic acid dehydrogenase